ncbi:MAG: helix-hairpin-helix domain-containing protein [Burkholderiaceae bacterium]|nr:helix-hairpin-helix domain-containing protein [Burkholderiaceae bacterium]
MRHHVIGCALILACAAVSVGGVGASAPVADPHAPARPAPKAPNKGASAAPVKPIDINSASRAQLKSLPGIGDAEADRIISARPYLSKAHLVTEAGLPTGVYLSIRRQIVAVQNKQARAKLKALAASQGRVGP